MGLRRGMPLWVFWALALISMVFLVAVFAEAPLGARTESDVAFMFGCSGAYLGSIVPLLGSDSGATS